MKLHNIINVYKDNGIYCIFFSIRNLINKLYNYFFLKKYNINSDISSDIYGIKYFHVGSLKIGRYCRIEAISLYSGIRYTPKLVVGHRVIFNDRVHIACASSVEIGNDCLFASNILISDHNHGDYKGNTTTSLNEVVALRPLAIKSVQIGNNVWLGENVVVLPGARVGNNVIIGANAVVCGNIPDNCIAVGNPAKVKKYINYTL